MIAHLKLEIEKLRRTLYGRARSAARLFNQLELEEVEAAATKDELERSAPLLTDFEAWLRAECARLSRSSNLLKPINYLLNRWDGFARFVYDRRTSILTGIGPATQRLSRNCRRST